MTTMILTTIGIIVAAASALMVVFYGGNRYYADDAKAKANTLINAGNNVRDAAGVYYATRGQLPESPETLLSAGALSMMPSVDGIGQNQASWGDFGASGDATKKAYTVRGISDEVCRIVNGHRAAGGQETILSQPAGLVGCYAEPDGTNVYYSMLNEAAS